MSTTTVRKTTYQVWRFRSLPIWPVNTDYSTHRDVTVHRHICPTCKRMFECPNPWLGEVCQAVEWFTHDDDSTCRETPDSATGGEGALASEADLESLKQNLHRIAPGYRSQAQEAVPVA